MHAIYGIPRAGAMCACSGACLPVLHGVFALYRALVPVDECSNKRINEQRIDIGDVEGAKNRYVLRVGQSRFSSDSGHLRSSWDLHQRRTKRPVEVSPHHCEYTDTFSLLIAPLGEP